MAKGEGFKDEIYAKDKAYAGEKALVPENVMKNFKGFIDKVTDNIAKKTIADDENNKFTVNELIKIEKDIVKSELINSGVPNPDKYVRNIVEYINSEYQPLLDMIDDSYTNGIEGINRDVSAVNDFIDKDENYSQDAYKDEIYDEALEQAYSDIDLYLSDAMKKKEGANDTDGYKFTIAESDIDKAAADAMDKVLSNDAYKKLSENKDAYYAFFDDLITHALDKIDEQNAIATPDVADNGSVAENHDKEKEELYPDNKNIISALSDVLL